MKDFGSPEKNKEFDELYLEEIRLKERLDEVRNRKREIRQEAPKPKSKKTLKAEYLQELRDTHLLIPKRKFARGLARYFHPDGQQNYVTIAKEIGVTPPNVREATEYLFRLWRRSWDAGDAAKEEREKEI